ncbi:DUF4393 domain-containing protein [Sulfuricurvum sp.]|uniref:DUF4393 domain-containing protein n=1 Tax=Sulfuricurvum sp. TaxID=2025608 RepID=UPI002622B79E|nr:DUF4393 domain-containing protein [Sulfuricurvum sp.]MDD2266666.1 DUF4393 domain-containing protein [Sulfuricurvum sp.]MDD2783365.1 DUF4393 domain-containing protein [Sulfuricurvum sp.]
MPELPIKADLSESANDILKELALPSARQVGEALGNVFGLFNTLTLPIKFGNVYAKRNFAKYAEKLENIVEENIKQVEPEIAIPIMEKLSYTSNEDLANVFANLLANASNKSKVDLIHPGFIQKLNSLAPDEARLLEYFKENPGDISYIIFKAVNSTDASYRELSLKLTGIEKKLNLTPKQVVIHLENLVSLSILQDNNGLFRTDDEIYNKIKREYTNDEERYQNDVLNKKYKPMDTLDIDKSFYSITSLGRIFIEACTN